MPCKQLAKSNKYSLQNAFLVQCTLCANIMNRLMYTIFVMSACDYQSSIGMQKLCHVCALQAYIIYSMHIIMQ